MRPQVLLLLSIVACGPTPLGEGDDGGGDAAAPNGNDPPQSDRRDEPCVQQVLDEPPAVVWVGAANGIVVEVDAHSGEELARYDVGEAHDGDFVHVTARGDVLADGFRAFALIEGQGCVDPPGEDACIAWRIETGDRVGLSAAAWSELCGTPDASAWAMRTSGDPTADVVEVVALAAADGATKVVTELSDEGDLGVGWVAGRFYGASDAAGNYWVMPDQLHLFRIDPSGGIEDWGEPTAHVGTGLTIDADGFVYRCAAQVSRLDRTRGEWISGWANPDRADDGAARPAGCLADPDRDVLWLVGEGPSGAHVWGLRRDTLDLSGHALDLPGAESVSVDDEGMLWVFTPTMAQRVDPDSGEVLVTFDAAQHGLEWIAAGFDATGRTAFAAGAR
jgi:hypothetical protein